MPYPRFTLCPRFLLSALLCGILPAAANPIPSDEESLLNGADLYEQYCAECHGWDIDAQDSGLYALDEEDELYDFSDLIDGDESAVLSTQASQNADEEWPEWAEFPDPRTQDNDDSIGAGTLVGPTGALDDPYGDEDAQVVDDSLLDDSPFDDSSGDNDSGIEGDAYPKDDPGESGRAFGATDLTDPEAYFFGYAEEDIFYSIAEGTGPVMLSWRDELGSEDAIWDLVNYIRSLWGEEWLE